MEWGDEWGGEWGGAIAPIEDHAEQAVSRLIQPYEGKSTFRKLVGDIYGDRIQRLENVISDLVTLFDLDNAYGDVLDKLGDKLGYPRQGFSDDDYRVFLKARAQILLPKRRTVTGLLELARALLGPKSLAALGEPLFNPEMSTLVDRITGSVGVPIDVAYDKDRDTRVFNNITPPSSQIVFPSIKDMTGRPYTVSHRIRLTDLTQYANFWHLLTSSGGFAQFLRVKENGSVEFRCRTTGTAVQRVSNAGVVSLNRDVHITATWDYTLLASGIRIFVDGYEVASYVTNQNGTGTLRPADAEWRCGQENNIAPVGDLRDWYVYDRILTDSEILTLSRGGSRYIDYSEIYPKAFQIVLEALTETEERVFVDFLRLCRPATYNGTLLVIPDPAFGFDDSTGAITTIRKGFDNASGPPNFGGPYAHVLQL